MNFDSILGSTFTPITNRYIDISINPTSGRVVRQSVARGILRPDIVFAVDDLGSFLGTPNISRRTTTAGWFNSAALNTAVSGSLEGPGVIAPGIVIYFSDILPYTFNVPGGTDFDGGVPRAWGSFDGTDRPPVVYPVFQHPLVPQLSLEYLRSLATQRK